MRLLAIETCMAACSAAVTGEDGAGQTVALRELRERGHAEAIMPMVAAAMERAHCRFQDLERIAVTVGPGSFSGVRVGVAAARGLALATGAPLVGLTTLAVMAKGARRVLGLGEEPLAVAHDARRGQVYFAFFDGKGGALGEIALLAPAAAADLLEKGARVAGSGARLLAEARPGARFRTALPDLLPDAADLALMALKARPVEGPVSPLYLRPPDAKPQTGQAAPRRK